MTHETHSLTELATEYKAARNKVRVTITKPVLDVKGRILEPNTLRQFEKMLLNNTGGFSRRFIDGTWKGKDGTIYKDQSTVYEMIIDNNPSIIANLRQQALVIKQEMKQEAVLFTVEPMTLVEFI